MAKESWKPPEFVSRERVIKDTEDVLGVSDVSVHKTEDIFRVHTLGLDWDIGVVVYEPEDSARIPMAPDGKKAGFFLLHGGFGDFKYVECVSLLLATKFGYKVLVGTFPSQIGRAHV